MNRFALLMTIVLITLTAGSAAALDSPAPRLVNYQGLLTDQTTGQPLDGTYVVTFSVYSDSLGANLVWSETHLALPVDDGLFHVAIGSQSSGGVPLLVVQERDRFLGVSVAGGPDLEPRTRLTSVPWALRAAIADSVAGGGGGGADDDWITSGENLYAGVSGNVGVGVTNPRRRIEVLGNEDGGGIRWGTTNGSSLVGDIYHAGGGSGFIINSSAGGGSWADLHLQTNGNTRLFVDSSGKLGVGTTTPTQKLDVDGTVQMTGFRLPMSPGNGWVLTSDASGGGTWQPSGGATGDGDWTVSGSNIFSSVSGNVGIGISSPSCKLNVVSGSTTGEMCDYDSNALAQSWSGISGMYGSQAEGHLGRRGVTLGNETRYGVYGRAGGVTNAFGVMGTNDDSGNYGHVGGPDFGATGVNGSTYNVGSLGTEDHGVHGLNKVSGTGDNPGVYGINEPTGNYAYLGGDYLGAYARHSGTLNNVQMGSSAFALRAQAFSGDAGLFYGNVQVVGGRLTTDEIEITGGSDLSENFDIADGDGGDSPEPGLVVSIDPERAGRLAVSHEAYDRKVAGIISGAGGIAPGLLMGQRGSVADGANPVALSGRVYCWVDATREPVVPGDLLTTADIPGHAMKVTDYERAQGAIIGKAMTELREGRGLVLVLVRPQ